MLTLPYLLYSILSPALACNIALLWDVVLPKLNRSVELGGASSLENELAVRMVLAMISFFFVCWLPYTALSVVVVDPELHMPPLLATMPMYFAKTPSSTS